jgi:hypothetical protein
MSDETSGDVVPKEKPARYPVPESVIQGGFGFLRDVFDKDVPFKSKILGLAFIAGSGLLTLADRLRKGRYNEMVFKLQNGDFACEDLEPTTRYGAYLLKNEVKYTCAIGLPTGFTKFFTGSIVVGFEGEFDSSQEDFMRSSLYQSGQEILIK